MWIWWNKHHGSLYILQEQRIIVWLIMIHYVGAWIIRISIMVSDGKGFSLGLRKNGAVLSDLDKTFSFTRDYIFAHVGSQKISPHRIIRRELVKTHVLWDIIGPWIKRGNWSPWFFVFCVRTKNNCVTNYHSLCRCLGDKN